MPRQPEHRRDLVIDPPWSLTKDGRQLLLIDDGVDDKIVVLCTTENLERLIL